MQFSLLHGGEILLLQKKKKKTHMWDWKTGDKDGDWEKGKGTVGGSERVIRARSSVGRSAQEGQRRAIDAVQSKFRRREGAKVS